MAKLINEDVYEETIQILNTFASNVSESSQIMKDASSECVENCENDEASTKSYERVIMCTRSFEQAAERAMALAKAMQQELEMAREAARKANRI